MSKYIFISTIFLLSVSITSLGQPYKVDRDGYIADSGFHRIIRAKGYQLIGKFAASVSDSTKQTAWVRTDKGWTMIDNSGQLIQTFKSDNTRPGARIVEAPAYNPANVQTIAAPQMKPMPSFTYREVNGKIGTESRDGKTGIPFIFDRITNIDTAASVVQSGKKFGVYLNNGKLLVPVEYEAVRTLRYDHKERSDLFLVSKNNLWTLINNKGKLVMPFEYENIMQALTDKDCFIVLKNKKFKLINAKGKALSAEYHWIDINLTEPYLKYAVTQDNGQKLWGLITTSGKVITAPVFSEIKRFSSSHSIVTEGSGASNRETLIENASGKKTGKTYCHIETPSRGLSKITVNCYYPGNAGFMDTTGKEVISTIYTEIDNFNKSGIAVMNAGDRSNTAYSKGVIAQNGKVIIPPSYYSVMIDDQAKIITASRESLLTMFDYEGRSYFSDKPYADVQHAGGNIYTYRYKGTSGLIDKQGNLLLETSYFRLEPSGENLKAMLKGKYGLINRQGRLLLPVKYSYIYSPDNHFFVKNIFKTERDSKKYLADLYGNEILAEAEPSFD